MTSAPTGLEALIADLAESDAEHSLMSSAASLLAYASPPIDPPASLRDRVFRALEVEVPRAPSYVHEGFFFAHSEFFDWIQLPDNNRIKFIYTDQTGARTAIVEMPADVLFPAHDHDHVEDLYLIEGDAWVAGVHMNAGDYCRAPAGTAHVDIRSGSRGAKAVVISR